MYRFLNPNPISARVGDCVVRAVSIVTDQTWEEAYCGIASVGLDMADMPSSNNVWGAYLRQRGWRRDLIPDHLSEEYTVADFAIDHPEGSYVVATSGHVVAVVDGIYYDTWDSGREIPLYYWYKEGR